MNLNEQYAGACASWVRYSRYEFRQFPDGVRVMPAADAVPQLYNPLETAWEMLAEAMELGRQRRQDLADIDEAVLRFAERYGLLGIAVDLPSDPDFFRSREILLPENDFGFTPGTIPIGEYLDRFFPEGTLPCPEDTLGIAAGREESYNLVFSRGYGERLSWIRDYFAGLERVYSRRDSASSSPLTRPHTLRYQVTGGVQPRLQWVFPSLESVLDLALAQSLCAEEPVLRVCKNCGKIYYNPHARSEFCSVRCRNQYNVRAWRSRQRENV